MREKRCEIRVSASEFCLIEEIANRSERENRSQTIIRAVLFYAKSEHNDLYEQFCKDNQAELKARLKEPRKRFKKQIEQIKEETKDNGTES